MEGNMRNDVAHALLRAVSALVPTPAPGRPSATHQGVETSLDTARKSACATWLLLAAACPFLAQTPLTLQDAEALAIKNHPQVQAAQLNYQASQQAVAEARSAYFPTLQGLLADACPFLAQTPLTLQDAEALAIKNHPQVQAAQLNYQASQQAVAEARSASCR